MVLPAACQSGSAANQPGGGLCIRSFFEAGKPVGVICHGPWSLIEADVVSGRTLTSWPSLRTDLRNAGAESVDEEVIINNGLVSESRTGRPRRLSRRRSWRNSNDRCGCDPVPRRRGDSHLATNVHVQGVDLDILGWILVIAAAARFPHRLLSGGDLERARPAREVAAEERRQRRLRRCAAPLTRDIARRCDQPQRWAIG